MIKRTHSSMDAVYTEDHWRAAVLNGNSLQSIDDHAPLCRVEKAALVATRSLANGIVRKWRV